MPSHGHWHMRVNRQVASSAAGSADESKANVEHRGRRLEGERQERVQGGMELIIQGAHGSVGRSTARRSGACQRGGMAHSRLLLLLLLLLLAFSVLRRVDQRLVCLWCEVGAWLGGRNKLRRDAIIALTMPASVAGAHKQQQKEHCAGATHATGHRRRRRPPPPGSGSACSPGAFQSARTCSG